MKAFTGRFLDLPSWLHATWAITLGLISYSLIEAKKEVEYQAGFFEILASTFLSVGNPFICLAVAYFSYKIMVSIIKIELVGFIFAVLVFGAMKIGIEAFAAHIPGVDWRYHQQCASSRYC